MRLHAACLRTVVLATVCLIELLGQDVSQLAAIEPPVSHAHQRLARPAGRRLGGIVVDQHGKPVAGVSVKLMRPRRQEQTPDVVTDHSGTFEIPIRPEERALPLIMASNSNGSLMAFQKVPIVEASSSQVTHVRLELEPTVPINVSVADLSGNPVVGAIAAVGSQDVYAPFLARTNAKGVASFRFPQGLPLYKFYALDPVAGIALHRPTDSQAPTSGQASLVLAKDVVRPIMLTFVESRPIKVRATLTHSGVPLAGIRVCPRDLFFQADRQFVELDSLFDTASVVTDQDGIATFPWFPDGMLLQLMRIQLGTEDERKWCVASQEPMGTGTLEIKLSHLVPISGRVFGPDGKTVEGIQIKGEGKGVLTFAKSDVKTNAQGRFEILAQPDQSWLIAVIDKKWAAVPHNLLVTPESEVSNLDFKLVPATRIFGVVTSGAEKTPVADFSLSFELQGDAAPQPKAPNQFPVRARISYWTKTDQQGRYELFVSPGKYEPGFNSNPKFRSLEVSDQPSVEYNFAFPQQESTPLEGVVVRGDPPQPVANARVENRIWSGAAVIDEFSVRTDSGGRFTANRKTAITDLFVTDKSEQFAGIARALLKDKQVSIALNPLLAVTGTLVDDSGSPLANQEIHYEIYAPIVPQEYSNHVKTRFGGTIRTDSTGKFSVKYPQANPSFYMTLSSFDIALSKPNGTYGRFLGRVRPGTKSPVDIGNLKLQPRDPSEK